MRRAAAGAAVLALVLGATGCFGPDSNVTESGMGLPELQVEIPSSAEPGATIRARFTVTNPGPGDIPSLFLAFSRVGVAGQEQIPDPLVDTGVGGESASIASIDPEPDSISQDATTFRFGSLQVGQSTTVTFDIVVPERPGLYANAVVAYDGRDVERGRGERIQTQVGPP